MEDLEYYPNTYFYSKESIKRCAAREEVFEFHNLLKLIHEAYVETVEEP
jgi:hypothetical protein